MLTQEQINEDWTVRSDNYNNYVEEEFATNRPEKWLELIESQAPAELPFTDSGCRMWTRFFLCAVVKGRSSRDWH